MAKCHTQRDTAVAIVTLGAAPSVISAEISDLCVLCPDTEDVAV